MKGLKIEVILDTGSLKYLKRGDYVNGTSTEPHNKNLQIFKESMEGTVFIIDCEYFDVEEI